MKKPLPILLLTLACLYPSISRADLSFTHVGKKYENVRCTGISSRGTVSISHSKGTAKIPPSALPWEILATLAEDNSNNKAAGVRHKALGTIVAVRATGVVVSCDTLEEGRQTKGEKKIRKDPNGFGLGDRNVKDSGTTLDGIILVRDKKGKVNEAVQLNVYPDGSELYDGDRILAFSVSKPGTKRFVKKETHLITEEIELKNKEGKVMKAAFVRVEGAKGVFQRKNERGAVKTFKYPLADFDPATEKMLREKFIAWAKS